ncbi:MAG: hypothetical protein ACD_78C00311G0001 [uncultured bacterium (gcode 4)]|uniref:Uncharacterized protein n=1 Tax=uncultured bacterium (gcode 4) TaxID=1234023 RepID=K1XXQ0_9BACT|nr:MAG: hypothetical protein ACD_78C00311G0001 [uncultured bacterium (gcode 4)]
MNFTAKLRILEGAVQWNLNDRETQIIKDTLTFSDKLTGTVGTDKVLTIPEDMQLSADEKELVTFYNENITKLPKWSDIVLIDELARRHMLALAKNEAGWSGKWVEAGYNLFSMKAYAAITAQHIGNRVEVVGNNGAVAAEGKSNARKIDLSAMGITVEKIDKTKIKYTLPAMDTIPEELTELGATTENGKVVLISKTPLDFHRDTIYHINGDTETRITLNKKEQSTMVVSPALSVASQRGVSKSAQGAREKFNESKTLWGSIYVMSRHKDKYPKFDAMLVQIGNRQYDAAYENLASQAQYGSKTAKKILLLIDSNPSNRDQVLQAINTYTYGSAAKNAKSINTKEYKKNRDKKTIAAENLLSPGNAASEAFFASKETHTSQHVNIFFPEQALSVSVFATPKGGTHRIDKYNGSIQVGGRPYIDGEKGATMSDVQKDNILENHKSAVEKNRAELNAYLKDIAKVDTQLTLSQYTQMLKTWEIPEVLEAQKFTMTKKPQFFEARAMINGNVCVNRVDGLAFPTFQAPKLPPQVIVVPEIATEWLGAPVGVLIATTTEAGVGIGFKKGGESAEQQPTNTVPGGTQSGEVTNVPGVPDAPIF